MKRWLANLFIVILLLSLTGCISYKENNKETERDTIVISVLAGQSTSDAGVEDMVDEWMEKNFPQVYLECTGMNPRNYRIELQGEEEA